MSGFRRFLKRVQQTWARSQIGRRSMYSVERLYALDEYSQTVSRTRMIAVCLLTPLPALLLVVAIELIPLQDPNAGWTNNYGAWLRFGVISFSVGLGLTVQMKDMTVGVSISAWELVAVAFATSICHVGLTVAMASFWVFPVPFSFVLTVPPFTCVMTIFAFLAVGRESIAAAPNLKNQVQSLMQVIVAQSTIAISYVGLSGVYAALPSHAQIVFVALMPFVKLVFKNLVAHASAFLEEYVSGIVVFSAELAHALFVAACMQTSRSALISVVIISFDALSSILSLRSIYRGTRTVQKMLLKPSNTDDPNWKPELLTTVTQICQNAKVVSCDAFTDSNISLRSPLHVNLSPDNQQALARIEQFKNAETSKQNQQSRGEMQATLTKVQQSVRSYRIASLKMVKMPSIRVSPTIPVPIANANTSSVATVEEQVKMVRETAQMMFHCEYVVLIEYVECVIPVVYGLYLQALYHLGGDAHEYYPQTRNMTIDKLDSVVGNLVVYVSMEILSLVVLCIVVQRRFGVSIIRQLAFVLETHAIQVQGRLFVWIPFILTFTLQHFGSDFTFQFEWMQNKNN